jgi:hypothetical protein
MTSKEKHPHIDRPSEEQLVDVLQRTSPTLRQLYLDAHRLVLETLPDVQFSVDSHDGVMGYGARQYGYDGWGMAALGAQARWVSLMFMRGADLGDPSQILEGTGKNMRHAKLRSLDQLGERRGELQRLILAASRLNQV